MLKNLGQNRLTRSLDWEDVQSVLDVCSNRNGIAMSVAAGGDIALSLLTKSFSSLTVVACNETERMLFELKLKAIQSLHPDNVYNLLGVHPGGRRVFVYHQLREVLSEEGRLWWDQYEDFIREGVLDIGQQESRHQRLKVWMKRLRLSTDKISFGSLKEHKRWALLEPILHKIVGGRPSDTFWEDDNPYAHMLLHRQWNVDILQSGVLTLSYEGMQSIQRSTMELCMMTGSFKGCMDAEKCGTFSIVYLGSLSDMRRMETIDQNFWTQLHSLLIEDGTVLCWSQSQPSTSVFQWYQYEGPIRSVHSGVLWIGRRL